MLSPSLYEDGPGDYLMVINLGVFGFILQNLESPNFATFILPSFGSKSTYL